MQQLNSWDLCSMLHSLLMEDVRLKAICVLTKMKTGPWKLPFKLHLCALWSNQDVNKYNQRLAKTLINLNTKIQDTNSVFPKMITSLSICFSSYTNNIIVLIQICRNQADHQYKSNIVCYDSQGCGLGFCCDWIIRILIWKTISDALVWSVYKITLNLCQICLRDQTNHFWLPYLGLLDHYWSQCNNLRKIPLQLPERWWPLKNLIQIVLHQRNYFTFLAFAFKNFWRIKTFKENSYGFIS